MKWHAQVAAGRWYVANVMILNKKRWPTQDCSRTRMPQEQYESSVRNLMSRTCLRNMAPDWLNSEVQHISQSIPDEERNIIKKGWDQLYLEPIRKEGFLETARSAQEVTRLERLKQQEKMKFKE